MGRSFTDEETSFQTDKVVILTDAYWRQHFNADPHVIGTQLRVDGLRNTIVGVLPPGVRFLSSEARLYFPFSSRPEDRGSGQRHSGGNSKHIDRKSTRLNSSHLVISYAVFCLKKK